MEIDNTDLKMELEAERYFAVDELAHDELLNETQELHFPVENLTGDAFTYNIEREKTNELPGLSLEEGEEMVKNWARAVSQNRYYSNSLGWNVFYDQINDLLLPLSGYQNISLGEEAFAQAVAAWQKSQGFSPKDSDGIIGPYTWGHMKPMIVASPVVSVSVSGPVTGSVPSSQNTLDFNRWHAQKILDNMNAGVVSVNSYLRLNPKTQLEQIASGQTVLHVNPANRIIQVLPVMYHICEQARINNFRDIMIGSFIREADSDGSCTGHCEGRCIDINYTGGSFTKEGSVQMVINILSYLQSLPAKYKQNLGFGLPLQGDFFGKKQLRKFRSVQVINLVNEQLKQLILTLGYVFPDNDNHMHIQVRWL